MSRKIALAAVVALAGLAGSAAPAVATLRYCEPTFDVNCYDQSSERFCTVYTLGVCYLASDFLRPSS